MTDPIADVLDWVKAHPGAGLGITDVPGATNDELAALATLGRLCGAALVRLSPSYSADDALLQFCHGNQPVSDWFTGQRCPAPPPETVAALLAVLYADGDDGLAHLYSQLVAPARRRKLGTFFTRALEVDRMITGWSEHAPAPATVIDIGAGVGIYTISAADHWPEATVHAIDINPVTLGLLALRIASVSSDIVSQDGTEVVNSGVKASRRSAAPKCPAPATPRCADAASLDTVQLVLGDYVTWATDNWVSLPAPRLILGNPPYTRMQLLPLDVRQDLYERSHGLLGKRASLAVLMTAISVTLLEAGDGLCLLLPAQWLESDYAVELRTWLWEATSRRVELRLFSSALFDDAQVDAVSLLIGPKHDTTQPLRVGTNDSDLRTRERTGPNPGEWRSMFNSCDRADTAPSNSEVDIAIYPADSPDTRRTSTRRKQPTLADLATIRRGVATGANRFFVLSEADRERLDIPYDFVKPLVRRLRGAHSETIKDRPWLHPSQITRQTNSADENDTSVAEMAWLLVTGSCPTDEAVNAYIKTGENGGASAALLCYQRPQWYDLTPQVHEVDVAISPMSKGTFRVLEAPADATVLNNLYGLVWRGTVSASLRARTLVFLRSAAGQETIRRSARSQANGLLKIEPKAFGGISIT